MEDKVRIVHLGGQDENGKNLTCVEINDDIFVIDCGIKMPDKTKHGIDFIIPRFDYLLKNKDRVRAYILTKGDDLVIGGLPYLIKRVPAKLYCTDVTRIFLDSFCEHHHARVQFDYDIVNPCDKRIIANRKIRFFQTASALARSFGVAISTSKGNIVFVDDYVIDNNCDNGYVSNTKELSEISGEETLLLMLDSSYATKPGYTNPKFKLVPLVERTFKDAQGRIFVALETNDVYNTEMIIKLGIKYGRKIYAYDDTIREIYYRVVKTYRFEIPSKYIGYLDDVSRARPNEVLIIMSGFGSRIYHKISLFATGQHSDKRIKLIQGDTFILGLHSDNSNETLASEVVNELYRNDGIKIIYFNKKQFLKMRASEEDIKTMITTFRPKYYIPISGMFTKLLANAKIALNTGIGLNHSNVFVLDNGMIFEINEKGASISNEMALVGDLLVDGINVGDGNTSTIEDRAIFGDDGALVIGFSYSKSLRKITYGPDIQPRGIMTIKESERLIKELGKVLEISLNECFALEKVNKIHVQNVVSENISKACRRITLKDPKIILSIYEEE